MPIKSRTRPLICPHCAGHVNRRMHVLWNGVAYHAKCVLEVSLENFRAA